MSLSREQFDQEWKKAGELATEPTLGMAWRRYQYTQTSEYVKKPESSEPTIAQLIDAFKPLLEHPEVKPLVSSHTFLTVPANHMPWLPTGMMVTDDHIISAIATGRTWRSKLLDYWLTPQANLWYRIGVNGPVFNSTRDTKSFGCLDDQQGELYLTHHAPGMFSDKNGGRVMGKLGVYDNAEGAFHVLLIKWEKGIGLGDEVRSAWDTLHSVAQVMDAAQRSHFNPYGLINTARDRLNSNYFINKFPRGWTMLWFLGVSEIFSEEDPSTGESDTPALAFRPDEQELRLPEGDEDEVAVRQLSPEQVASRIPAPMIRCRPEHTVGILQKDLFPTYPLGPDTVTTWSWNITDLPSRMREDTEISHDYLSVAYEFENGRDITYTWSWELPVDYGYWCPFANWTDQEYHVVIRSGTEQLGQWLHEKRNLYEDYVKYINGEDTNRTVPRQITRVWLIAGNKLQRHRGEMLVKSIKLLHSQNPSDVLSVL